MEQHQMYAVLGFLFLCGCSNLIVFSQEAAQYEQQARQRAIQNVALHMRRMQQYQKRLQRVRHYHAQNALLSTSLPLFGTTSGPQDPKFLSGPGFACLVE